MLDEARIALGDKIPYNDQLFDAVVAVNVLEHLGAPESVFAEVSRVLKPGGLFMVKTPNRIHYVTLAAQLTPYRFHRFYNCLPGRQEADTFPTLYRANTSSAFHKYATSANFSVESIHLVESRPEYLQWSALTYLPGIVYERIVNSTPLLAQLRVVVIAVMRKRA